MEALDLLLKFSAFKILIVDARSATVLWNILTFHQSSCMLNDSIIVNFVETSWLWKESERVNFWGYTFLINQFLLYYGFILWDLLSVDSDHISNVSGKALPRNPDVPRSNPGIILRTLLLVVVIVVPSEVRARSYLS